jgi:putative transposase
MPQSLSRLLTHVIYSTKNRDPLIAPHLLSELHAYLVGVLEAIDCTPLRIGGTENHVHLFFALARTRTIAEIVEKTKTSSSKWIKTKGTAFANFHWQAGYGAFSVSQSDAERVVAYIANQPKHHKRISFQEEYRRFLERYAIAYDERYVWD